MTPFVQRARVWWWLPIAMIPVLLSGLAIAWNLRRSDDDWIDARFVWDGPGQRTYELSVRPRQEDDTLPPDALVRADVLMPWREWYGDSNVHFETSLLTNDDRHLNLGIRKADGGIAEAVRWNLRLEDDASAQNLPGGRVWVEHRTRTHGDYGDPAFVITVYIPTALPDRIVECGAHSLPAEELPFMRTLVRQFCDSVQVFARQP